MNIERRRIVTAYLALAIVAGAVAGLVATGYTMDGHYNSPMFRGFFVASMALFVGLVSFWAGEVSAKP